MLILRRDEALVRRALATWDCNASVGGVQCVYWIEAKPKPQSQFEKIFWFFFIKKNGLIDLFYW
ncbi:hypothetical protein [Acidiphilium acidophilum]|uniref:Uncharacterized protein n=1 Tax=Acidiphilium acidophilum TaxID=76588 RepID=A0AAW9DS86_ACIAO|nr:hypothetical protein [Acidiphilium acidophilum]MDX5930927.1 hypothetical protein [Acidiphilium acidophilum]